MKILITGATGLVGQAIVEVLKKKNISINYLTTRKQKIVSSKNYNGFYWNPAKGEYDIHAFDGVTSVINLAGATISKKWTTAYKKTIVNSRLNSLQTLKKGIQNSNSHYIQTFISASAIGIYPSSPITLYEENEEAIDDSFLGEVVAACENEIDSFNSFDFKVSKIRIGLVLSGDDGALPKIAQPINNYVGAVLGDGLQWQSWIHIHDLARVFLFVLEHQLEGTFNGVAPNPVTNEKLIKEVAKALNKPILLPNVPKFMMKLILGEMAYLLFASQRVTSKRIEKKGFVFKYKNICSALESIYNTTSATQNSVEPTYEKTFN